MTLIGMTEDVSRRSALRRFAMVAGGASVFGTAALSGRALAADKMAQSAVAYQASPQGAEACENCLLFEKPAACKVVEGNISPGGWCKIYAKKTA